MRINLHSLNRQARAARAGVAFKVGCTGKSRYHTALAAERAADFLRRNAGGEASWYRCTHCKKFHVSSQP